VRDQQLAATPTNHRHLALPDRLGQINRREGCPGGDGLACTVFHGDAAELAEEMQRPPAAGGWRRPISRCRRWPPPGRPHRVRRGSASGC